MVDGQNNLGRERHSALIKHEGRVTTDALGQHKDFSIEGSPNSRSARNRRDASRGVWSSVLIGISFVASMAALLLFVLRETGFLPLSSIQLASNDSIKGPDELAVLIGEVDELKKQFRELEWGQIWRDLEGVALIRPGESGYSLVRFDLGVLTVSLTDVASFAGGTRVQLQFGNPLSTRINGLKTTIDYGRVTEDGRSVLETTGTKEVSFVESLRPGAWTNMSVVLDGIKPDDLGFLRVKEVSHRGIELSQ